MNSNKLKDDFFGLNSDSDSNESIQENNSKWNWENSNNQDFCFNQNKSQNESLKRKNHDLSDELATTKKSSIDTKKHQNDSNLPYKLRYLINAHSNSINRIYWNYQMRNSNLLLSSSLDK
jgi:hypothetical protein